MVDRKGNSVRFALRLLAGSVRGCYVLFIFVVILFVSSTVLAQGDSDDEIAPPPIKMLSQEEKAKLASEPEVKRRTKLGLELMDARLKQAEAFDAGENYERMFLELGGFHALMDNMLEFLNKSDKDSNKVLNNFKRFEIGLRGFTARLEMIRHDLPIRYDQYLRNLVKNLRAARARAIEPLFDNTVVPAKKPA